MLENDYVPFPEMEKRDDAQTLIEIPLLARLLPLPGRLRALEIGCGTGVSLAPLQAAFDLRSLVGVEVDPVCVAKARARVATLGFSAQIVEADARTLPFPDGSFDVVFDFGTCYHISRRELALREVARVLARDGRFVCETRLNQLISHPRRSWGRRLPWSAVATLLPQRSTLMWQVRVKA